MAQRVEILLEDDLDGSEAAETIAFSLDGGHYEIDLSDANAANLREDIGRWAAHARRTGGRRARGTSASARPGATKPATSGKRDLTEIRTWARTNGYEVSDRGRVSGEILEAFDSAH